MSAMGKKLATAGSLSLLTWDRKARRDASVSFAPPHNLVRPAPRKSSSKIGHHLFHGLHAG
jgi:hypothetical protein